MQRINKLPVPGYTAVVAIPEGESPNCGPASQIDGDVVPLGPGLPVPEGAQGLDPLVVLEDVRGLVEAAQGDLVNDLGCGNTFLES